MKKICYLWLAIMFFGMLMCICSCTAGITMGKYQSVHQTVTNSADSTTTIFRIGK